IYMLNVTHNVLCFQYKTQFFHKKSELSEFTFGGEADRLFFSRQIGIDPITGQEVPVNGGGKITGKLADFDLGLLDISTRAEFPNPEANYGVARVKRSLFGESYVGAMYVDKRSGDPTDPYNETG